MPVSQNLGGPQFTGKTKTQTLLVREVKIIKVTLTLWTLSNFSTEGDAKAYAEFLLPRPTVLSMELGLPNSNLSLLGRRLSSI